MGLLRGDVAAALDREFGYIPDEQDGEKWCVWQDRVLIVVHPYRKPRLYERGGRGNYVELEPELR